ncbi:hypothetical protein ACN1NW_000443 [Acinetobacter baumannii]|uniref:hypothetical protein n=1 Tax=Acinetobacter baumannii TaxID=470 RepID=UPI00189A9CC2|nr:hypothetical protein [Acinetobacter baumannii]EKV5470847.1 hypothetical protein [Acinetobacter baumannii]ELA7031027.1 hypothetical protein [Acinetobacter baumannii]ELA7118790.1 hypothetical protein [Acinetobacter baumannii]ELB0919739.1 hypothetical protein [Acinetobacter baumannii]ELB0965916.1 hypothetical protein [Acinetobacter baumannii]
MSNIAISETELLKQTEEWFEDTLKRLGEIVKDEDEKQIILNTGEEKILLDNPKDIRIARNTLRAILNTLQYTFPYSTKEVISE